MKPFISVYPSAFQHPQCPVQILEGFLTSLRKGVRGWMHPLFYRKHASFLSGLKLPSSPAAAAAVTLRYGSTRLWYMTTDR